MGGFPGSARRDGQGDGPARDHANLRGEDAGRTVPGPVGGLRASLQPNAGGWLVRRHEPQQGAHAVHPASGGCGGGLEVGDRGSGVLAGNTGSGLNEGGIACWSPGRTLHSDRKASRSRKSHALLQFVCNPLLAWLQGKKEWQPRKIRAWKS